MNKSIVQTTDTRFLAASALVGDRAAAERFDSSWDAHQAILAWREKASDEDNDAVRFVILND